MQEEKVLIAKQKKYGSANIFKHNLEFECADVSNNQEEKTTFE